MEDYRQDGFNAGYGQGWRNNYHEQPYTDGDRYSYQTGYEEGSRRRRIADEVDILNFKKLSHQKRWNISTI